MADLSTGIQRHYGSTAIVERVLTAVANSGQDASRLTVEMLYPYDQFHGRGLVATRENSAKLNLDATMRVLDVGSGVGGPARYMASTFGCRVTGIDLTDDFVAAAKELTERCGLSDKVEFRQGDALAMPFGEASFDAVSCLNVAMNIRDKTGLAREICRVLKPHGRLVWTEAVQGPEGPPHYPLPWARNPDISFLVSEAELRRAMEGARLRIVEWIDETEAMRAVLAQAGRNPQQSASSMTANQVILGEDFPERLKNAARNVLEQRLVLIFAIAERA
jgi:ubiquinone/menaquinone biosynthesis C-methylase UbiE